MNTHQLSQLKLVLNPTFVGTIQAGQVMIDSLCSYAPALVAARREKRSDAPECSIEFQLYWGLFGVRRVFVYSENPAD